MRVLISLLSGATPDLNLARRRVPHDRLVLIVHPGAEAQAEAVRMAEERIGGHGIVTLVHVAGSDAAEQMKALEALLDDHRNDRVVLNAAGGDAALSAACLYTAYRRGLETWFFQEDHAERLPVLDGLDISERVTELEGRILLILGPDGTTSRVLAEKMVVPRERIETACRSLRKKGLLRLVARDGLAWATRTEAGEYVREHLEARRGRPRLKA